MSKSIGRVGFDQVARTKPQAFAAVAVPINMYTYGISIASFLSDSESQHSRKCLQLLKAEDGLEAAQKLPAPGADDVGDFDGRPGHGCRYRLMTKNLRQPITCSKAKAAAAAAPEASFLPVTHSERSRWTHFMVGKAIADRVPAHPPLHPCCGNR
jgi:hypothetical protein